MCCAPTAYPRSRGATWSFSLPPPVAQGLSPLARGNRCLTFAHTVACGPIPARAGQPQQRHPASAAQRAYPRSRGATELVKLAADLHVGLSPLARGNQVAKLHQCVVFGPIPARAGQPRWPALLHRRVGAYPRSRGATAAGLEAKALLQGLSPLARGNLTHSPVHLLVFGPIPARAGQPGQCEIGPQLVWAYPRSRGATSRTQLVVVQKEF